MSWHRIKKPIVCICQKSDWCMVNDDGSEFLCMRVQSSKQVNLKDGSYGWVHRVSERPMLAPIRPQERRECLGTDTLESMLKTAAKATGGSQMAKLATDLGVRVSSLMEMRVSYGTWHEKKDGHDRTYSAWWFPMRDGNGNVVGLRARDWHGNKWAVTGSRSGLFYPYCHPEDDLWICEGASDVCALRSMNLYAIGRPSCNSGVLDLKVLTERQKPNRIYILADNDGPGIAGAETLARHLMHPCCLMTLPCKDVRELLSSGGNAQLLESLSQSAIWRNCL